MARLSEDDELAAGFYDLLSPEELAALTDIALLSLLDGPDDGSARRRQLEREWNLRGLVQVAEPPKAEEHHAADKSARPGNKVADPERRWWEKPVGQLGIGVAIVAIGALVPHLFRTHLGLTP